MPIPALAATAATGTAVAAPCRKIRRLYLPRESTSLMASSSVLYFYVNGLTEAAAFLDYFDLVAVGVRDKKEARQCCAVVLEVAQRSRRQFLALETRVLG